MGKRVPLDERPFNPVEAALVRSVLAENPPPAEPLPVSVPPAVEPSRLREQESSFVQVDIQPPPAPPSHPTAHALPVEKLIREKRVLLTQGEEREVERIVTRLAAELSTPVKLSHLLRACVTLLRHAENQLADQARQVGPLARPSNGDPAALAAFEHRLAQILSAAFRDAARLR